jgi:hypothetical protein
VVFEGAVSEVAAFEVAAVEVAVFESAMFKALRALKTAEGVTETECAAMIAAYNRV